MYQDQFEISYSLESEFETTIVVTTSFDDSSDVRIEKLTIFKGQNTAEQSMEITDLVEALMKDNFETIEQLVTDKSYERASDIIREVA